MNVEHVNNNEAHYDQWSDEISSQKIGEIPLGVELRVRH